jgi:hypothetical protein
VQILGPPDSFPYWGWDSYQVNYADFSIKFLPMLVSFQLHICINNDSLGWSHEISRQANDKEFSCTVGLKAVCIVEINLTVTKYRGNKKLIGNRR